MASVALAFGSFGDIVALIQIIIDLTGTLRDGKAPAEYKELIAELGSLQGVLENIKAEIISPGMGAPVLDRSSLNAIELAVQRCYSLIKDFSDRTRGYTKSLLVGEPGAIMDLREQLMQQKTAMILVLSLSSSTSLHRMEQRLKQISTVRAAHEQRYELPVNVPYAAISPDLSIEESEPLRRTPEIALSFVGSPLVPPLSSPSLLSYNRPSESTFDNHIHTFLPEETLHGNTPFHTSHEYQMPLSPPDSAPLTPIPQPPPKPVKPGWRSVPKTKKRPPRINTNVIDPLSPTWDPLSFPRAPSPGLFGPRSPDSADGRTSNIGKPGGHGRVPPPPTSPASQISTTDYQVPILPTYGESVGRGGPFYLDTGYRQGEWNYSPPSPSMLEHTPLGPRNNMNTTRPTSWANWRPSSDLESSPPFSPIPAVDPRGLFGPRTPDTIYR